MIEALMSDDLINRVGGRFRLTALIQKRWLELLQGSRPLVDPAGLTELEVVVQEIAQGKINIDFDASGLPPPPAVVAYKGPA
jgi:DNA-directed RNA polymerase subunit omega